MSGIRTDLTGQVAIVTGSTSGIGAAMAEALHDNLRLWTLLAADVAGEENELPAQLRARIFYLAEFTRAHSAKLLSGEAERRPLIDINTAVMKGLRAGVADGGADPHRFAVLFAGDRHDAAAGLNHHVIGRFQGVGAGVAKARDRAVDQPREPGVQVFPAVAKPLHHAGPVVFQ